MIVTDLLTKTKKLNNYDIDATAGGLWETDKVYKAEVPTGKRWHLFGGIIFRDVASTMTAAIFDSADNIILYIADHGSGAGIAYYPESTNVGSVIFPWPMDPGEYLKATMGTSQTGSAYGTCVVLEVKA